MWLQTVPKVLPRQGLVTRRSDPAESFAEARSMMRAESFFIDDWELKAEVVQI